MSARTVRCHVWTATSRSADALLLAVLDEDERRRWQRLRHPRDRDTYLVTHALARAVAGLATGREPERVSWRRRCGRCGGPHGKPLLENAAGVDVSISHSAGRAVVAIAEGASVGVDIERLTRDDVTGIHSLVLRPREHAAVCVVAPAARHEATLRLWTRKEALLKASGCGLAVPFTHVEVTGPSEPPRLLSWRDAPVAVDDVRLADLRPGPGYVGCVAALSGPIAVVEHDATPLLNSMVEPGRGARRQLALLGRSPG